MRPESSTAPCLRALACVKTMALWRVEPEAGFKIFFPLENVCHLLSIGLWLRTADYGS